MRHKLRFLLLTFLLGIASLDGALHLGECTVSNTVVSNSYSTNGVTKIWPYTFQITLSTDIEVFVTTGGTQTQITSNFTVDTSAKTVTYPSVASGLAAITTGSTIKLQRASPLTQLLALTSQGTFDAHNIESAFDKLTLITQEISNGVQGPVGPTGPNGGDKYNGTYSGSLSIANSGVITPTLATGLAYVVGQSIRFGYDASNFMSGIVGAYSSTTGVSSVTLNAATGAGTYSTWSYSLTQIVSLPIADSNLSTISTAGKVDGAALTDFTAIPSGAGVIPAANLPATTAGVLGSYKNLAVTYATTATFSVAADEIVLETSGNTKLIVRSVSGTVSDASNGAVNKLDAGTVAADTIYYVWIISNGSASGGLMSLSSTAPTLPSGYTYKALVSAVGTNHSSNLIAFSQVGSKYRFTTWGTMASGNPGVAAWTSFTLNPANKTTNAAFVPSAISTFAVGAIELSGGNTVQITNTSSASFGANVSSANVYQYAGIASQIMKGSWALDVLTADTLYWTSDTASGKVYLAGFDINKL